MKRETETFQEMVARIRKANARLTDRRPEPANAEESFRIVLGELELLSHGSTQSFAAAPGGGSDEGYGRPPGDEFPPHIRWRGEWEKNAREEREGKRTPAEANERREEILRHARDELVAHRKRDMARVVVVQESEEDLEARVVKEGKDWSIEETARHCRVTPTFVRKARLKAETDAKAADALTAEEKHERCRELAENGMSERQIEMVTKLPKTTIRRILGRAA